MPNTSRTVTLALVSLLTLAACKKKQVDTGVSPGGPAPTETCDAACRAAREAAERARRDSIEADRLRVEREAREAREARERAVAGIKATLGQKVYFEYDMAELSAEGRALLDAKLAIMMANVGVRVRITGHADDRGSDEYNLALGQRRAAAVKKYLTDRGVDESRIDILSLGEERPEVTDGTEEAFRLNRRAEFEIVAGGDTLVPPR